MARLSVGILAQFSGVFAVAFGIGCGGAGTGGPRKDGGTDGVAATRRVQPLMAQSDSRGVVRLGAAAADQIELLLVDAETQRPVEGAIAYALIEEDAAGYLVRVGKDEGGYLPQVVRCMRGQTRTVPLPPATPDVPARGVRVNQRVHDEDFLAETDLPGVNALAEREGRPEIMFMPALDPSVPMAGHRFAVYRAALPNTLLAVRMTDKRPGDGTPVRGQARVVVTAGARRAGARVEPQQLASAAEARTGEDQPVPQVTSLAATPPDAMGTTALTWTIDDPMGRVIAIDVGVDTTQPDRRLPRDARAVPLSVKRGEHFACVRPVFEGADLDPQLQCTRFLAQAAPAAANVRVNVKVPEQMAMAAPARKPVPVEVQVENTGEVDAPSFEIDVVVSRDGRLEGGLGEVRRLVVDGVRAGQTAVRRTDITPSRDGSFFVVARADALRRLSEANGEDNLGRRPIRVMPVGNNRAPVLSIAGTAQGAGSNTLPKGSVLKLSASASDPEDGNLSSRITWWSSRDGQLGAGPTLSMAMLSPGRHRVQARVEDQGLPAVRTTGRQQRDPDGKLRPEPLVVRATEPPQTVTAELELTVVDGSATIVNSLPVISAGPDLTTTVGAKVSPFASARDPDQDPLQFTWTATGPEGAGAMLMGASELRPVLAPAVPGNYTLKLTVSDGKASESDEVLVRVLPASANKAPQVSLTVSPESRVGLPVRASAMATDEDGDGLTLSFALSRPMGSATLLTEADTNMPGFVPDLPGMYTLVAKADDGKGGASQASASVMVLPRDDGAVDAGAPVADGGVAADAGIIVVTDAGTGTPGQCQAVPQLGCQAGEGCFPVAPGDVTSCAPAGTGPPGAFCQSHAQCSPGTACVGGVCRLLCDVAQRMCPPDRPVCVLGPENARLGVCEVSMMPPACDPVGQVGCPSAQTCQVIDMAGARSCTLTGGVGLDGFCNAHSDCTFSLGCFDGPDGRRCRQYCPPATRTCGAGTCTTIAPEVGICLPAFAADGGTTAPPDGPVSCNPVTQTGCGQAPEACYAQPNNVQQCMLPGPKPADAPCLAPNECAGGLGCFDGPGGRLCRPYCDTRSPACPTQWPDCLPIPGSPWGFCVPPPPDGGMMVMCDPAAQTGCMRAEDACYLLDSGGKVACLLAGTIGEDGLCGMTEECDRGLSCLDGPDGRRCRPVCHTAAPVCPSHKPQCAPLGSGYGMCLAPPPPPDSGVDADGPDAGVDADADGPDADAGVDADAEVDGGIDQDAEVVEPDLAAMEEDAMPL